jgi:hypothetical protein
MFVIPKLESTKLRQIAVCAHVDLAPNGKLSRESLEHYDCFLVGKFEVPGGEDIFIRRIVDVDDDTCHFHIEAAIAAALGFAPTDLNPLDEVLAEIPELQNEVVGTTFWGRKRFPRSAVPSGGVVETLLGAETSIGAFSLSLTGSTFAVHGDGPFNEVKWWLLNEAKEIGVELTAWDKIQINANVLSQVADQMETGIEMLVLEGKSDVKSSSR